MYLNREIGRTAIYMLLPLKSNDFMALKQRHEVF